MLCQTQAITSMNKIEVVLVMQELKAQKGKENNVIGGRTQLGRVLLESQCNKVITVILSHHT